MSGPQRTNGRRAISGRQQSSGQLQRARGGLTPPRARRWAALLAMAVLGASCAPPEEGSRLAGLTEELHAARFPRPYDLPVTTLTDQHGEPFELRSEARGKVTVLYFGYTQCPDVCPVTMARVARALSMLEPDVREHVLPVFITLDPPRDPPEQLQRWLGGLDSTLVGLTGTQEQVEDAVGQLGFRLPPLERPEAGWYEVAHPATLFVYTPELLGRFGYPEGSATPEEIAQDLRALVAFDW